MKSGSTALSGYNWPKADEPVKTDALFKAMKQSTKQTVLLTVVSSERTCLVPLVWGIGNYLALGVGVVGTITQDSCRQETPAQVT